MESALAQSGAEAGAIDVRLQELHDGARKHAYLSRKHRRKAHLLYAKFEELCNVYGIAIETAKETAKSNGGHSDVSNSSQASG